MIAILVVSAAAVASAQPAAAHGIGGRTDLPIPFWHFAWAASFALLASFAILGRFWTKPRLSRAARGVALRKGLPAAARLLLAVTRLIGLLLFGILIYAALGGSPEVSSNIAPYALFIAFWVGIQLVSAVVGDVWAALDPFRSLSWIGAFLRSRATGTPMSPTEQGAGTRWWAVATILTFLGLELAFHQGALPRTIGIYLVMYTLIMLAGVAVRGRGWAREADGFGVLFSTLAAMAPLHRDDAGTWRLRPPLAGLAHLKTVPGTAAFILVVLGSTTFDGLARSSLWLEVVSNRSGWALTAYNTAGLIFAVGVVMFIYRMAIALMARMTGEEEWELGDVFVPSLVPIMAAYTVAHYFTYLVIEGQNLIRLISDPFGQGWDLFGTSDYPIDYTLLSVAAVAWIQTAAIAIGHVLAVIVAHDRAVERYPQQLAVRSQYPMLAAMLIYTLVGLLLLLGA